MRRAVGPVFVLAALGASFAFGQPETSSTEQAQRHLRVGEILYNLGYYEETITELKAAYQLAPLSAFFFNFGLAYRRSGELEKAKEYFQKFVDAHTDEEERFEEKVEDAQKQIEELTAILDAPPDKAKKLLAREEKVTREEKRDGEKKLLQENRGLLVVTSAPAPARLILNAGNVPGGLTPYVEYLPPGKYVLEINAEGRDPFVREVKLDPKRPQVILADLSQKKALLTVLVDQEGAVIELDGEEVGRGPKVGPLEVVAGSHTLFVSRPGFRSYQRELSLDPGAQSQLDVQLTRRSFFASPAFRYGLLGGSLASLSGGVIFGLVAQNKAQEAADLVVVDPVFDEDFAALVAAGQAAENRQILFLAAGGGALLASGILFLARKREPKRQKKETKDPSPFQLLPAFGGGVLRVSF